MACPNSKIFADFATAVAKAAGFGGWIGISDWGIARAVGKCRLLLDGDSIGRPRLGKLVLPPSWNRCKHLSVGSARRRFLGDPVCLTSVLRVFGGILGATEFQLNGWAASPGDPERLLTIDIFDAARGNHLTRVRADSTETAPPSMKLPVVAGFCVDLRDLPTSNPVRLFISTDSKAFPGGLNNAISQDTELAGSPWRRDAGGAVPVRQ
jgi:hypothetical protein